MEHITKEIVVQLICNTSHEFKSTHNRLCIPIINRIYLKMQGGIKFPPIKVAEGLIIDGHHRYVASLLAQFSLEKMPSVTTSATITTDWESIEFVTEDWDTEAKIKMLNEKDAAFNDKRLEDIINLLK